MTPTSNRVPRPPTAIPAVTETGHPVDGSLPTSESVGSAEVKPTAPTAGSAAAPSWLQPLQLTIEQTAILTSYSVRTLKRLVADGAIPGVTRVGRCLRFNRRAIERWLEEGCPRPGRRSGRR